MWCIRGLSSQDPVLQRKLHTAEADRQPHMRVALATLKKAKNQLVAATPDKGGHRVKAIELVTSAIAEVEAGIKFDNTH